MRKLSRFGAAALALALSVTFLTPVQAQAAKPENSTSLKLKKNLYDGSYDERYDELYSDVIDEDKITLGDITGKANDKQSAYENAEENIALALAGKGLATTTKPATGGYDEIVTADGTKYYTCYNHEWDESGYNDDGTYTFKGVYTWKYTNTQTKKSSVFLKEVQNNYTSDEAKARSFQSALRVKKGEITYVAVPLTGGDTTIEKVKSSKKSIAKVSLYKNKSYENITNADNVDYESVWDEAAKKNTYTVFYYTTVGAKVVVGTYETWEDAQAAMKNAGMTASSATRYLKVDAKKSGKTKLTFNIKNKNGNVSKVSTTIHVVDDTDIFSKLTYAGQSLLPDKDLEKKSFYSIPNATFYTTKAKGKLVAKANKNIVIKKIEKGVLYTENYNYGMEGTNPDGSKYDHSDSYSAYSRSGKTTTHKVDLNGDGDFDDKINGVYESKVTFKYTKIKSGKTLKLSKVGDSCDSKYSWTRKDSKNSNGEFISGSETKKTRNFYAPTMIRVTYYDKLLKTYGTASYTINLKVSK